MSEPILAASGFAVSELPTTYGMPCTRAAFDGLSAEIKHKDNTYA